LGRGRPRRWRRCRAGTSAGAPVLGLARPSRVPLRNQLSRPLEQQVLTRAVVVCRSCEPRRQLVGRSLGSGRRRTHPQPRLKDGTEDPLAASGERGSTGRAVRRGLRDGLRRQSSSRGQPIGGPCFRAADMPPSTRRSVPVT
jgi:hypothetical protein